MFVDLGFFGMILGVFQFVIKLRRSIERKWIIIIQYYTFLQLIHISLLVLYRPAPLLWYSLLNLCLKLIDMYICMYVHMYICTYVHMYVCGCWNIMLQMYTLG
jgi:hypothetical protein